MVENYLIVLQDSASPRVGEAVMAYVRKHGGRVDVVMNQGRLLVVALPGELIDPVRRLPGVMQVGGVRIGVRPVVRRVIVEK